MKRILANDPLTHSTTYWHRDPVTRVTTIEVVQNVAPYLEEIKRERNHDTGGALRMTDRTRKQVRNGWVKMASIPNSVLTDWMCKDGLKPFTKEGMARIAKKLDDPDYAYLRTNHMRIGTQTTWR